MTKFYITSAIPYVNAKPHIGWAMEIIQSDVVARYHRFLGKEVFYLCGSDENSLKNVQAAEKEKLPIQKFVDTYSQYFIDLAKELNVHFDIFQKGSTSDHHKSSQALWKRCVANGDIYKKIYTGLYCVGCEMFYTRDELNEKGECFEHPGKKLEEVKEENYFFKLSRYREKLLELITSNKLEVIPEFRKNEVISFLKGIVQDISISRSNERAKNWGVSVPGDDTQKMYVWFDALNIYQSGVGFAQDEKTYKKWWPADVHVIGKGIIRFHAVYWPAFLLSAKLSLPRKLFVHEYITVDGQKMSKSLGNIVDPFELIKTYGTDAVRFYFLRYLSPFSDGDFSKEKFEQAYNADLANGLGNLVARVGKLAENANYTHMGSSDHSNEHIVSNDSYTTALNEYRFNDALSYVWQKISDLDKYINEEKPWQLVKTNIDRANSVLAHCIDQIQEITLFLEPFLPETAQKIQEQFKGPKIVAQQPLFPRV